MLDSLEFRKNVLSFVESMKDTKGPFWAYKLTKDSDYSVFSFCFSIFIKNMFGELTNIDKKVKSEWITFLQNLQDKNTGLFIDPESKSKATDSEHDSNHLNIQLTTFCVAALDCLDSSSRYPLKFVEEYYNPSYLNDWLGKLNWRRSSNSGNKVMFIAICLIYNYERFGIRKAKLALDVWFMWMDKNQNSKTGFWSIDTNGSYMQGMSGFYHQFVIYMYMDRQVQYQSKLVDKLLFIQQPDGLFYPGNGGGSCYDIDGITPLIYFYKNNNYRRNEIKEALERALDSILFNQQKDGGFCWAKREYGNFSTYKYLFGNIFYKHDLFYWYFGIRRFVTSKLIQSLAKPKIETGWTFYQRFEDESSLFDTWLRCTTIAEICEVIDDHPLSEFDFRYQEIPGLCWFPKK